MKPKTVVVHGAEKEQDPNLLMLDGRDVRSVSRGERRKAGFRGPVMQAGAPSLPRFIREHADSMGFSPITRRQHKVRARIRRLVAARGLA